MKLRLSLLQRVVDLPTTDPVEIRRTLDDLGIEVKNYEKVGDDTEYTIETLANRGDHLYALGVAREFCARFLSTLKLPAVASELPAKKSSIIARKTTGKCIRYALLEMSVESLTALRPDVALYSEVTEGRHPIVSLLNYVQLELGQPMHAFDRDKVEGEILVALSEREEQIEALDGHTYRVPAGSIVIRDKQKIIAVGGVIGCANTMVTPDTKRVLIESALFDPICVRLTARGMGIKTDASHAFERGCDYEGVVQALKRVVHLTSSPSGEGKSSAVAHAVGWMSVDADDAPKRSVQLRWGALKKQLNAPRLSEAEVLVRLKHLGFGVTASPETKDVLQVTVPTWRIWDIDGEGDLIEEVARSIGLNKIKLALPALDYDPPAEHPTDLLLRRIEPSLHGSGFLEVITKVFYSGREVEMLERMQPGITSTHMSMKNSLESSYSHLKVTNLLHLAGLAEQNHRRGIRSVKVYEIGRLFFGEKIDQSRFEYEQEVLTLAASGRWFQHEWRQPESREEMLPLFKGVCEAIVRSIGRAFSVTEGDDPLLHPGYQGRIKAGRSLCGTFGLIHPALKDALGLKQDLFYAQFLVDVLAGAMQEPTFEQRIDLPTIRRDITLRVEPRFFAERASRWISELKPEYLRDIVIIDDFKRAEEDFRRVTYRLTFQSAERTLEHDEIDRSMERVLGELKAKHELVLA